jgi:16S rRNA processing protein RimM
VQVETETGEVLGKIVEVLSNPAANDVYVVHGMRGELLIPGIHDVVQSLDVAEKRMVIRLLPGLLPEDS